MRLFDKISAHYKAELYNGGCIISNGCNVVAVGGYDGNRVIVSFDRRTLIFDTFETAKEFIDSSLGLEQ